MLYAIVRPSVCLSVVCDVGAPYSGGWTFPQFFSPYDSRVTLLFWCQKSLVGDAPFPLKFASKVTHPFQTAQFWPISAHSASTVIASEKSSIRTYRKSTTRFPTNHRWTVYDITVCASKIQLLSKKVCYKVSLYENFQRQSCSYIIPLSKGP